MSSLPSSLLSLSLPSYSFPNPPSFILSSQPIQELGKDKGWMKEKDRRVCDGVKNAWHESL